MSDKNAEERLLKKIRNLFALSANDGATGAEAETALRMANALLDKHKIDKYRLHEQEEVFASFCDYPNTKWIRQVCNIIGRFYNCQVILDQAWEVPKTLIIGTSVNRLTAVIVIDQLIVQIKHEMKGKGALFTNGIILGLADKCNAIIAEKAKGATEAVPGTGMTIVDIDKQSLMAASDFMHKQFPNLVESKARRIRYDQKGRDYGRGLGVEAKGSIGGGQKCLN